MQQMPLEKVIAFLLAVFSLGIAGLVIFGIVVFVAMHERFELTAFGRAAILVGASAMLWGILTTWLWSLKWRKLGLENSWTFLRGPRPLEPAALAAWRWGRQTFYAWLAIMLSMGLFALTEFR